MTTQFVTSTDFNTAPYSLPNLDKVINSFNKFVLQEQERVLRDLLGNKLFEAFAQAVDTPGPLAQRWTDLKDGKAYTFATFDYRWKGMKELFKPYIYSAWLTEQVNTVTGVGVVEAKPENGELVNAGHRISKAWNQYADIAGNADVLNWCFPWEDLIADTLYGYLYYSEDKYTADINPDQMPVYLLKYWHMPGYKNTFGI